MTRLDQIMTRNVASVAETTTLRELAEFFVEEDVSGAPVLSAGTVVGVVSVTDLIQFDADGRGVPAYEAVESTEANADERRWHTEETDGPSSYFSEPWDEPGARVRTRLGSSDPLWSSLEDHTVDEVMTRDLLTLPVDADVKQAALSMVEADVHRLLVMDDGRLAGLITTTDIVRAVSDRGLGAD